MYLYISHLPSCTLSLGLYVNDLVLETISFFLFLSVMVSRCHLSPEGRLFVGIGAARREQRAQTQRLASNCWSSLWRWITSPHNAPRDKVRPLSLQHQLPPWVPCLATTPVAFVYRVISSNDVLLLSFVAEPRLLLCPFGGIPGLRPRGLTVRSTSRQF